MALPLQPGRAERGDVPSAGLRPPHDHQPEQSAFVQDSWTRNRLTTAGRAALGPRVELLAGRGQRHDADVAVQRGGDLVPGRAGRRWLQRHHAARGRRLRSVRQRQDGGEVQLGQVPRIRGERRAVHLEQPGRDHPIRRHQPRLDRRQRQQGRRLRSQHDRAERQRTATRAEHSSRRTSARRAPSPRSTRTSSAVGASGRAITSGPPWCSRSSCPACRWKSATRAATSSTSWSPTI